MKIDEEAFIQGLERGRGRAAVHFQVNMEPGRAGVLREALQIWPFQSNPRFVSLFVEVWAIADAARHANREPPLSLEEIFAFLGASASFLNSFTHR